MSASSIGALTLLYQGLGGSKGIHFVSYRVIVSMLAVRFRLPTAFSELKAQVHSARPLNLALFLAL